MVDVGEKVVVVNGVQRRGCICMNLRGERDEKGEDNKSTPPPEL